MNQYPGYLTPEDVPEDSHCRTFNIPNSTQWLSVFMGALLPLIYPESWQKYGALTPDEAADAALNVIWDAYAQDTGQCIAIEAPFWDNIEDADDEYPDNPTQPWYGVMEGETFVEQVQDWVIASFIAYSGAPSAAIQFLTIAPAFRLAWKSSNVGGIVQVIVDAVEIGRVDTYSASPGIVTLDVAELDPEEEHLLHLVLMPDESAMRFSIPSPAMQVIRKKLDPGEVIPPGQRYSEAEDCIEVFNGTSWSCSPAADPRHDDALRFPPIGGSDPQCQAAANMSRAIEDFIADVVNTLSWATVAEATLSTVLTAAAIFFPATVAVGVFAILALDIGTILFGAGLVAIAAAFTAEVYDQLTCIFYCNIDADGQLIAGQLEAINTQIADEIGGLVSLVTSAMFLLMGEVGLSNAGATGDAPADCTECPCAWCFEIDFTATDGDFLPDTPNGLDAVYTPGVGWTQATFGSSTGTYIYRDIDPTVLTEVYFEYQAITPVTNTAILLGFEASFVVIDVEAADGSGVLSSALWTGSETVDQILLQVGNSNTGTGGTSTISLARFHGQGICPFGEPNC